jgi:hypothetical protein
MAIGERGIRPARGKNQRKARKTRAKKRVGRGNIFLTPNSVIYMRRYREKRRAGIKPVRKDE